MSITDELDQAQPSEEMAADAEAQLRALALMALKKSREDVEKVCCHLDHLMEQEAAVRAEFPDFELLHALSDPMFLRLTAPHTGLGLLDACYALHHEEIGRRAAQQSLEKLSRSLVSGGARPRECGAKHAAECFSPDPRRMTKAEREALKKRIYAAGALKEKIYPCV